MAKGEGEGTTGPRSDKCPMEFVVPVGMFGEWWNDKIDHKPLIIDMESLAAPNINVGGRREGLRPDGCRRRLFRR